MLENLRNELLGTEIDFVELDNYMMSEGFYTVFDDGATDNIKECENVAYMSKESGEWEVLISFKIIKDNEDDDHEENFVMKITEVENL